MLTIPISHTAVAGEGSKFFHKPFFDSSNYCADISLAPQLHFRSSYPHHVNHGKCTTTISTHFFQTKQIYETTSPDTFSEKFTLSSLRTPLFWRDTWQPASQAFPGFPYRLLVIYPQQHLPPLSCRPPIPLFPILQTNQCPISNTEVTQKYI